ncbi:MAG: hemerythrin domain-containing protein [Kiloniellales bacterium]
MPETLRQLREEHRNIARLLGALERQLAIFDRAERPDYDILLSIAEYFTGFPDRYHHPKEDLVLARLRARDPEAARTVGELGAEHQRLAERARHFREAIENVLKEAEVPRANVDAVIRHFIADQRRHMHMEEARFFPLAERTLTSQDWAAIDAEAGKPDDPLFGAACSGEFAALREDILRWERENQTA